MPFAPPFTAHSGGIDDRPPARNDMSLASEKVSSQNKPSADKYELTLSMAGMRVTRVTTARSKRGAELTPLHTFTLLDVSNCYAFDQLVVVAVPMKVRGVQTGVFACHVYKANDKAKVRLGRARVCWLTEPVGSRW